MAELILVRGIPGSGKSTLASKIAKSEGYVHLETDQYFTKDGKYVWDGMQIGHAHEWCRKAAESALNSGLNVIVSNTMTKISELKPYFDMIHYYGKNPQVITAQGQFGSIHGVPEKTLEAMKSRFVYDISSLFKKF